jgi:GT2 family glycosyltransferase
MDPRLSVIIPTHNRPEKLAETVRSLQNQTLASADYEIILVDDGSVPPVRLTQTTDHPSCTLIRLEGLERSAAGNAGARTARCELLVFVGDDLSQATGFLEAHWQAHQTWPDVLLVGAIRLRFVLSGRRCAPRGLAQRER